MDYADLRTGFSLISVLWYNIHITSFKQFTTIRENPVFKIRVVRDSFFLYRTLLHHSTSRVLDTVHGDECSWVNLFNLRCEPVDLKPGDHGEDDVNRLVA